MSRPADAVVVDLGAVGRASVALARWYRGLVATGEGDVDELGQARAQLAALPAQPGRLGRAIQLIVCGGEEASDAEIVAAVGLLCDAASRAATSPVVPPVAPLNPLVVSPRPRRHRSLDLTQPTLPGLAAPDAVAAPRR